MQMLQKEDCSVAMNKQQKDRIEKMESIFVPYPNLITIHNKLKEILFMDRSFAEPECVLITGYSGSGKTSFMKKFLSNHPVIHGDEVDIHPVIYVEIPSQANIKDLCIVILKALSDPFDNTKLTKNQLSPKVINFIKKTHTKLLVLDEFQHLTYNSSAAKVDNVANWIKYFINQTNIPVLIMGMPESEHILSENTQLSRRFYSRFKLSFFSISSAQGVSTYYKFLNDLSEEIEFENSTMILDKFYAISLFYLANNNMALLMRIIRFACRVAAFQSHKKLEDIHFLVTLFEMRHLKHIEEFLNIFQTHDYRLVQEKLVKESVDWNSIDEYFSN